MRAIRVHEPGSAEVMKYEEVAAPQPKPGDALVRLEAIGVNFIDVYHRTGQYKLTPPFSPGLEGAGTVTAVAPGVTDVAVGDRVAWAGVPGSYAEAVAAPVARLVKVPDGIDAASAAAAMLQGMTAHYLVHSTYPLRSGETALVHAAAGGVGLLLIQMAKRIGARVFGTVSTEAKARLAREAGADAVILYTQHDFEAETKRLTGGRGVQVVYDSVGKTTFDKSLNVLAPRGYLVLFGQSSGAVPPFDPQVLAARGALFLTRPTLAYYTATREELLQRTGDLFKWIRSSELRLRIEHRFPLAKAADAHRALEGRQTTGKVLLLP